MPAPWTNFLEPNILKQPSFLLDGLTRPSSFLPQCELMHCILGFLVYFSYLQLIRGYSCHFYTKQKKKKPAFFFLHHSTTIPRKQSTTPVLLLTLQMGALLPLILPLSLIWLQTCMITAEDLEWKSATATHTNQTDGSIIIEGACGYGDLHKASYGKYSAGLSTMLFNRGSACGACYEVRCVDHILWCLPGSPSVILTATDFCPPNYGLSADYGGWCNFPKEHFEMSEAAFAEIAEKRADIVPVQYRRVKCERRGGLRFTVSGSSHFYQVLVTNVGLDGEVIAVKVKGSRTGWIPMARNWGQNWQCNVNLIGQPLSFEVTTGGRRTLTSYNVAPANWQFGQTYEGKQF